MRSCRGRDSIKGGERPEAPSSEYQWKVLCLDLPSGKVLWERLVHRGTPPGPVHSKNSYASETPVTDGERVYAYFGNVGVFCFDMEGRPLWSKSLPPHATAGRLGHRRFARAASRPALPGQ